MSMASSKPLSRTASRLAARQFDALARRFVEAIRRRDYPAATQAAEAALKVQPKHLGVLADYAFALLREGRHAQAHPVYLRIHEATDGQPKAGATWLDGLTEVCGLCAYRAPVRHGRWQADLPFFLVEPIAAGRWTVELRD
jgi:hypothetical protein